MPSAADLKALKNIHTLMLDLEKNSDGVFRPEFLQPLKDRLQIFAGHESLEFRKIAEIADHLSANMTMKHYVSWIIPVERLLQKELRDDEFLIFSQDQTQKTVEKIPLSFVLHNLRSAFNVGSIFRTAECFGVSRVYLCGYTPLPTQEKLAKTAMGTDTLVAWEEAPKITGLLKRLKSEGHHIVALETTSHAVPLEEKFPSGKATVFVVGNERFGLDPEVLELCSEVRQIPLRGQKNSLNVGVAAALAAYEFSRQWSQK